jgi:hypothetical protein
MDTKSVIEELKNNIRQELELCDPLGTPYICANIENKASYERIEQLIIKKVITAHVTIGEAIIAIETDLNLQSYIQ